MTNENENTIGMEFVQVVTGSEDLSRNELLNRLNHDPRKVLENLSNEQVVEIQSHISSIEAACFE